MKAKYKVNIWHNNKINYLVWPVLAQILASFGDTSFALFPHAQAVVGAPALVCECCQYFS